MLSRVREMTLFCCGNYESATIWCVAGASPLWLGKLTCLLLVEGRYCWTGAMSVVRLSNLGKGGPLNCQIYFLSNFISQN